MISVQMILLQALSPHHIIMKAQLPLVRMASAAAAAAVVAVVAVVAESVVTHSTALRP